jgi:fumarate reductase subunit D
MATKNEKKEKLNFALGRENYKLLAIGFVIIVIGFLLMLGGRTKDPNEFSYDIFSFRRITLAPIVILAGFIFEIWAIMKKPKKESQKSGDRSPEQK